MLFIFWNCVTNINYNCCNTQGVECMLQKEIDKLNKELELHRKNTLRDKCRWLVIDCSEKMHETEKIANMYAKCIDDHWKNREPNREKWSIGELVNYFCYIIENSKFNNIGDNIDYHEIEQGIKNGELIPRFLSCIKKSDLIKAGFKNNGVIALIINHCKLLCQRYPNKDDDDDDDDNVSNGDRKVQFEPLSTKPMTTKCVFAPNGQIYKYDYVVKHLKDDKKYPHDNKEIENVQDEIQSLQSFPMYLDDFKLDNDPPNKKQKLMKNKNEND